MGISIRAYARHRGVTDTAVHKAIRAGRMPREYQLQLAGLR